MLYAQNVIPPNESSPIRGTFTVVDHVHAAWTDYGGKVGLQCMSGGLSERWSLKMGTVHQEMKSCLKLRKKEIILTFLLSLTVSSIDFEQAVIKHTSLTELDLTGNTLGALRFAT